MHHFPLLAASVLAFFVDISQKVGAKEFKEVRLFFYIFEQDIFCYSIFKIVTLFYIIFQKWPISACPHPSASIPRVRSDHFNSRVYSVRTSTSVNFFFISHLVLNLSDSYPSTLLVNFSARSFPINFATTSRSSSLMAQSNSARNTANFSLLLWR